VAVTKANKDSATRWLMMSCMFSLEYLAVHSVCGGNANENPMDETVAGEIISKYMQL
jgi:hypothetical protein